MCTRYATFAAEIIIRTAMIKRTLTSLLVFFGVLSASASQVGVYCMMGSEGSQIYCDHNIRLQIALTIDGTAVLEAENFTDQVMYIDLTRYFCMGATATIAQPTDDLCGRTKELGQHKQRTIS